MSLLTKPNINMFIFTFFVVISSGIIAMLVDIDHIPKVMGLTQNGRLWHTPLLCIAMLGVIYCSAYIGRLYYKYVLKGE